MKILIVTDNLYQNLVDLIKLLLIHIKFIQILILELVFNRNANFKKKLDLLFLIKNFDIIHYFGGWSLFHIKVMILSFILKKK